MASIHLHDIEIAFVSSDHRSRSLKRTLMSAWRGKKPETVSGQLVRALHDVTLTIEDGERVGLLGRNGAGKSTLLRVLSGVYDPHKGMAEISGHTCSLLSLGLGFFPDLDGYENITTSSLLYGATYAEARRKGPEIATFTELGDALKRPVRTYSAGMQMRLAFAVATSFTPEILLLDEVVGVGDHAFSARAFERIETLIGTVKILVLASHDESALRRFCKRGIVLENGGIAFDGPLEDAIKFYHQRT